MAMVRCPHSQILGEPQSLASLCWLACYTMLFRWKGCDEATIKGEIQDKLRGAGIDVDDARRSGLKLKDNKKAAKALGINAMGYGQSVTQSDLTQLVRQSPVWATGQWFPNQNHVYVIVGVSDQWVEYYDPWWEGTPEDAYGVKKAPLDWILKGDGKEQKGLDNTFQWFPLQYFKDGG